MIIKTGKENIKTQYKIHDINIVSETKYLGIYLNDKMNPADMIQKHLNKA